jgi:hypothetical protein
VNGTTLHDRARQAATAKAQLSKVDVLREAAAADSIVGSKLIDIVRLLAREAAREASADPSVGPASSGTLVCTRVGCVRTPIIALGTNANPRRR